MNAKSPASPNARPCRGPWRLDSIWDQAELNHLIGLGEIRGLKISEAEFGQDGCDLFSVLWRRPEEDIEITGVPGPAVKSQTVSADYDVLNAAGV